MSNIFTPPGTSQRNSQVDRQSGASTQLSGLLPGETAYQQQLQNFRSSQLPNLEQGVQNAYYNTTQGGRNAQVAAYGAQQQAHANSAAGQANAEFAGNPTLAQGYQLDQQNQANQATNNYAGYVNSPQEQNSAWGQYLNANQAASPNYSGATQLASGVYGQPQVPVGQGLGGFLGEALGSWAGAGFPSLSGLTGAFQTAPTQSNSPLSTLGWGGG
jgi:hypothetical protein